MTTINEEDSDSELTTQLTSLTQSDAQLTDMHQEMTELVESRDVLGEYMSLGSIKGQSSILFVLIILCTYFMCLLSYVLIICANPIC